MDVDPCSSNIYFIDFGPQAIKVLSHDGKFTKTLLATEADEKKQSSLQALALDNKYKSVTLS